MDVECAIVPKELNRLEVNPHSGKLYVVITANNAEAFFFSLFDNLAGIPVLRKSFFIFHQIQRAGNRHSSQMQADWIFPFSLL